MPGVARGISSSRYSSPIFRCGNGVRNGCDHVEIKVPVIDDRLYNEILEQQKDKAKYHLTNIVKASDLVTSTTEGHYTVILLCSNLYQLSELPRQF